MPARASAGSPEPAIASARSRAENEARDGAIGSAGTRSAAFVASPVDGAEACSAGVLAPAFFETIESVRALAVRDVRQPRSGSLAEIRAYRREDLFAIAEIAYHYLFSGAVKLAHVLFDGLSAVAPDEPYFALALGLTYDRMNDRAMALTHYRRAGELDSGDGRPDINIAELYLEAGDFDRARRYLARGTNKARARGEDALANKGTALLEHLAAAPR